MPSKNRQDYLNMTAPGIAVECSEKTGIYLIVC